MKILSVILFFITTLGFISCSDDNNFCVDEKKQIIIVHNLMSFKIVRDSLDVVGTREYTMNYNRSLNIINDS